MRKGRYTRAGFGTGVGPHRSRGQRGGRNNWRPYSRFGSISRTQPGSASQPATGSLNTFANTSGILPPSTSAVDLFNTVSSSDTSQVQIIHIVNPLQYPGWRLYFPTEPFEESSALAKKIEAFEHHVTRHPTAYALQQILKQQWFYVSSDILQNDQEFCASWVEFHKELGDSPSSVLPCLGVAIHRLLTVMRMSSIQSDSNPTHSHRRVLSIPKIHVRPINFNTTVTISDINPECYDRLIVINGRVTSISAAETKCTWIAYKCKRCGHEQAIRQLDNYPTKPLRCRIQCASKRRFVEIRTSPYTRIEHFQTIQIEDETFNNGISIQVEIRDDLVDSVCPGNIVSVTGVLKMKSMDIGVAHGSSKFFKDAIYVQSVSLLNQTALRCEKPPKMTQKDLEVIHMICGEPNCLRLLVQSLGPEICGNEMTKVGLILSLLGGYSDEREGEVNVLIVGDPGVGKSNFLRNAAGLADVTSFVSGKSPTSLMPLLQSVKQQHPANTGDFIDPGHVLRASQGHLCIDDFDKMQSSQESILNTMYTKIVSERSTDTSFNTVVKTSVISTVNPTSGHYDKSKYFFDNIRLNPSLLSLYHLKFIVYDKADKDEDNILTEHIKALHSGMKTILSIPTKYNVKPQQNSEKIDKLMSLNERVRVDVNEQLDLLPNILLKKYIKYAKYNIKPYLSNEALKEIKDFYLEQRKEKSAEEVTTRQLDGLIRLAQARARVDLSSEVTSIHVQDVLELVHFSFSQTSASDPFNSSLNSSVNERGQNSQVRKFIRILQLRSNALGKKIFEFKEMSELAAQSGITTNTLNLVETLNLQGYLIKKGPNIYELVSC